jgi:hypothetical protein
VPCKIKPDIFWFSTLIYSSAALCFYEPVVSSSTCDAHMGFQLNRMPASTKHDDGQIGAPPTSIYSYPYLSNAAVHRSAGRFNVILDLA